MESTHYRIQERIRISHSAHECAIPCTSKVTHLDPRYSTPPRPAKRTWRNTDRSLRVRVLKTFLQQNPEYTNTQQGLPDQWV
jgi:hypothetical protein